MDASSILLPKVLEKHWPHVQRFEDVRTVGAGSLAAVDIISGGFPCQDISEAGFRAGIESGARSGLWREYLRIIGELRPRFAVVENVSALLERDIGRVVGDLAGIRYDAEWELVSACSTGAPHTRERVFIVAYPQGEQFGQCRWLQQQENGNPQGDLPNWPNQPEPIRVVAGIPRRMDRLRSLGNSVVPQIAEWIGRRIIEAEAKQEESL